MSRLLRRLVMNSSQMRTMTKTLLQRARKRNRHRTANNDGDNQIKRKNKPKEKKRTPRILHYGLGIQYITLSRLRSSGTPPCSAGKTVVMNTRCEHAFLQGSRYLPRVLPHS